jgi:hypothetical protein
MKFSIAFSAAFIGSAAAFAPQQSPAFVTSKWGTNPL